MGSYLFSSESVTEGHPDKVADRISDTVLDAMLARDPKSRVACETLVTTGLALVAGEITTTAIVDIPQLVRQTVRDIGYTDAAMGFDADTCAVMVTLDKQSPDISMGVTAGEGLFSEQGAGDQGLMFGFACTETPEYMPMAISYAHQLTERLSLVRKDRTLSFLRPDGKSQVTIEYKNGKPTRVDTIVVAAQHTPDVTYDQIKEGIIEEVIKKVIPADLLDNTRYLINATGRFVVGGPLGDCGLTGRKIIVDTYGGYGAHGGGAFSGKDPSKVDRSASYMARYVAKNVVAAGLAEKCLLQVAYAIGYPEPVSLMVNSYGTGKIGDQKIAQAVSKVFSFKPAAIIEYLDLLRPIYFKTSAHGHFGREDPDFTWERTDKVQELKEAAGV
ncbi:methionine adenosyltransferase [Desulfomonile tiedjei DSM 6799]|uniref:S-adenosylmethionine synthase n=2 Tax=Desulfomonile tiedjei TaxID=2358 RepID=I4C8R7_DESTA|nr:methionine adenosyltransferase [Desulfomonile tiedjei]AFM25958.1 methionine adenosyltransferase [Desulfomonile tiedjei DSM 6799]